MRVVVLTLVALLAGCETLQPGPGPLDAILAEAVSAARAPFAEQQAALGRAQKGLGGGSAADRLRLATLLATLPRPSCWSRSRTPARPAWAGLQRYSPPRSTSAAA
jgi:hypothetical protein